MRCVPGKANKKGAGLSLRLSSSSTGAAGLLLRRGYRRRGRCRRLLGFQFLARVFRTLLQFFLQFALLLLYHLRIGRRAVIRLGEIGERQRQADRRALHVDRLQGDLLPLLHLGDHVVGDRVIGHAADREAYLVGLLGRLILIDHHVGAVLQLHAERNRDAQHLGLAFRLEQLDDRDRHAVFQAAVLGNDADLLVVGFWALAAHLQPRRIHELRRRFGAGLRLWRRRRGLRLLRLLLRRRLGGGRLFFRRGFRWLLRERGRRHPHGRCQQSRDD